jgi:hypothetical protein
VAESVFHLLPLVLFVSILLPLRRKVAVPRIVGAAIVLVVVTDPTYQVVFDGTPLAWIDRYTWLHLYAFAAARLDLLF